MNNRVLLNTQRKQLHDVLLERGVDPGLTRWTNAKKGWTNDSVDTLEVGVCHFLFNPGSNGTLSIHFRPSPDGGASLGAVNLPWKDVLNHFNSWAGQVKGELSQEDPWSQYSAYLPPERAGDSIDNSPFTHKEAEHVVRALHAFMERVKTLPHYEAVSKHFDPQMERLATQAKAGAGRIDWSNQFVGMLIGLCIALSLAPEAASELWQFWRQVIHGLFLP